MSNIIKPKTVDFENVPTTHVTKTGKKTPDFYKGTSLRWCREWEPGRSYVNDEYFVDIVYHQGRSWICVNSHFSSSENHPSENSSFWELSVNQSGSGIHVGPEPPTQEEYGDLYDKMLWLDTSVQEDSFKVYSAVEVDLKLDKLNEDCTKQWTELSNAKANKATTLAGYGITDSYTKTEVDNIQVTSIATAATDATTKAGAAKAAAEKTAADIATAKANVAEANAKAYTDDKNRAMNSRVKVLEEHDIYVEDDVNSAIADAKKAGTDAAAALEAYKTSNDTEVAKKANAVDVYTKDEVDDQISTINEAIKGGTKFIGVVNNHEELTAKNPDSGDIFVAASEFGNFKKDIEYIYDGENWYELGDSSANAQAIANLTTNKADKATVNTLNNTVNQIGENLSKTNDDVVELKETVSNISSYILITHSELKSLRDNKTLIPGVFYRITDYECTTVQADSRSANHPFDIIVQALDERTLSENARAIQRDGDTYFANAKLEVWQLKYALDNDASRFAWAKEEIKEQPARWSCGWGILEERYDNGASTNYTEATIDGMQKYLYRPTQPTSYLQGKTFYRYEGREVLEFEGASELYFVTRDNPFEVGEQTSQMLVIYAPTGRVISELEASSDNGETTDDSENTVWYTRFDSSLEMMTYGQTVDINGEVYYEWFPFNNDTWYTDDWASSNSPFVISEGTKIVYNGSTDSLYYAFDGIIGKSGGNVYEVTDGNDIYKYEDEVYGEEYLFDTISYTTYIAPREEGKGVIYRLIDEHNNDCPFDFKNMQFLHNGEWYYTFSYFGEDASLGDYCANNHLAIVQNQNDQNTVVTTTMPMLVFNLIHIASNKIVTGILNNDVQSPIAKGFIQGFRISGNKWLPTGGGYSSYFKTFNIYSSGSVYGNIFRGYANGFVVGSADKLIEQFYANTMTLSVINNFNINIDCTYFVGNTYNVLVSGSYAKKIVGGSIRNCYFDDYGVPDTSNVVLSFVANLAIDNCYIRLFDALTIKYGNTTSKNVPLRFLNIDARGWESGTTITIPSTFPANANYELKVAKNSNGEIKMWCDADLIQ